MNRFARWLMLAIAVASASPVDAAGPLRRLRNRGPRRPQVEQRVAPEAQKPQASEQAVVQPFGWGGGSGASGSGITYETAPTYGEIPVFDDTSNDYVATRAGAPVYSVKDPILYDPPGAEAARMVRAAGSDAQTTATTTASSTTVTLADASTYQRGNGIAISGAGASHGLSAPANCYAIPISVYQTEPDSNSTLAAVPFTVDQTNNTILLTPTSSNWSNQILMPLAPGDGIRLSQQGSTFPTHAAGTFSEGTTYYVAPLPETTTVAMSGTATAGTYRLYLRYKKWNQCFHLEQDSSLYCTVAYNGGWEVQTVVISGTPTGGTYTLTLSGYGTTAAIAHNADSATVQAALRLVAGLERVTVTQSGSTPNFTHTIRFIGAEGNIAQMTSASSLTGGTPLITHATTSAGTTSFDAAIRSLPGCAQVTVTQTGTSPNDTYTITWTGLPGRVELQYDLGDGLTTTPYGLTGGTPACTITSTRSGGYTLHDTAAHAIAGTDIYDINSSGSGFVEPYGDRTYTFQIASLSGKGGVTAASSTFSTAIGPRDLNEFNRMALCWDKVTGSHGEVIYGDTSGDLKPITAVAQLSAIHRVNLAAGGYTSFEPGDIGKTLSNGTVTGTIQCYDNASRNVWVYRANTAGFPTNGATITTTSGTGGGTQSGVSTRANVYMYTGRTFKRRYNYYASFNRKGGEKVFPGQVMEHGGNLYTCVDVTNDRRTAPDQTFTVNTGTNVVTFSTGLSNSTNGTRLYLSSSMALPAYSGGRLSSHQAVYGRFSGATATLHPTSADAIANTNVIDLTDSGYGTHYVQNPPTFSTTLGAYTNDGLALWRRVNQGYPSTPPASAINDLHLAIVMSKSGSDVVLSSAPATSVVSQLAVHDDTESILANHNAANASGAKSATVYFPTGNYQCTVIQPDSDPRLFNSAFGGGVNYYLFRWGAGSTGDWKDILWQGDAGARVNIASTWDQSVILGGSGFESGSGGFYTNTVGRATQSFNDLTLCNWALTTPVAEHPDGAGGPTWNSVDTDSTAGGGPSDGVRNAGPKYRRVRFHGWCSIGTSGLNPAYSRAELFEDCEVYAGGSNHNFLIYNNGGNIVRTYVCGVRGENSMAIYQDYDRGVPFNIDGCTFERAMKDGIAIRSHEFRAVNSKFSDCKQLFVREITNSFVVDNCDFYATAVNPISATTDVARDIRISNVRLIDSALNIGSSTYSNAVNVRDVQSLVTANPPGYTGGTSGYATFTGTNQTIEGCVFDRRIRQGDVRGPLLGGNGTYSCVKIRGGNGTWQGFGTSGSGYKVLDRCEFYAYGGGSTASIISHTGEMKVLNCKFGGTTYAWDGGGRTDFEGCTLDSGASFTFGTGITGPTYIRRNQWLGTVNYTEPSMFIEDNNSAAAPGMAGATQFTRGNSVADVKSVSATALAANANDYALPVTDTVILTTSGTNNYSITGLAARAAGTVVYIVNNDSTDNITLEHADAGSSAANRFRGTGGADVVLGPGESATAVYANTLWQVTEN